MSPRLRTALLVLLVALLASTAGIYVASLRETPPAPAVSADTTARLYALRLPDLANQVQPLAQWKGKVLVVNFWATWCPPCRKEIPEFDKTAQHFKDKDVQFVGISIDSPDKVRQFRDETQVTYPLLIAGLDTLEIADALGNRARALPFTVIFDRAGRLQHVKLGTLTQAQLTQQIESALAQPMASAAR